MPDNDKFENSSINAEDHGIAIGGISVGGNVGDIRIGHGLTAEEVSVLITQITSTFQPKPFDGRCPYKGLDVFDEEDAELFFGRERLVEDLVSRVKESRTVFVTGPSGSGKSSLVRAGLIHALKQGTIKSSEHWLYETMKPGREPLKDLALAFSRLKSPELEDYFLAHAGETDILNKCAESVLSGRKEQRFVLFIDQFEEVFTQINNEEERQAFLNMLAYAGTVENGRVIILFAMRSDFVSNCATYPALNELLSQQFRQIGAMQPEELVSAIALPARHVGLPVEDELIVRIINDMKGEPGALPLMQFALKDLFDAQQEKGGVIALMLEDYLKHGGIHKSLERHADKSFATLSENEQKLARSIFSGLIEIGRGTQDTKRTALFDELIPANTRAEDVLVIVQKLADARLIITDEQAGKDTVTISHEKLIEAWPWLKKLVNENRDAIALQNEIASDAKEWEDHQRDESYLYTGARLANAREQLEANKIVLNGLAQLFIDTGVKAYADELEAARQRTNQLRRRSVYLSAALVVALIAVGIAVFFSIQSRRQARISNARELAAVSIANLDFDQELSLHLAMQSINNTQTLQGEDALRRALLSPPVELTLLGHLGAVYHVEYDHEGKRLVTASEDGTARIWDIKDGRELIVLQGHNGAVYDAAFSLNGQFVATASADKTVRVWNAETGAQLCDLEKHADAINSLAISPDSKQIATASNDKTVRLWQVADCSEVYVLEHQAIVRTVAFSTDGKLLATGGHDTIVYIWNVSSRQLIDSISNGYESVSDIVFSSDSGSVLFNSHYGARLLNFIDLYEYEVNFTGGHTWYVSSVGFNPSNPRQVVTASLDQTVRIWDSATGKEIAVVRGQDGTVHSASFDPDGNHLATGSADQTVKIWDIGEWRKRVLIGHTDQILGASYSSDGRRIATTSYDGMIRIWDAQSGHQLKSWQYPVWAATGVVFSPDNRQILTSSDDGTWRLWNAETGEPEYESALITNYVHDAQFNRDGTRILTVNRDTFGYIWDVKTRELLIRLEGHTGWVASGMFSPDGKLVVTASSDGTARLWDAQTGEELRVLLGHSDLVVDAAFSSDGKRIVTASVDGTARIWDTNSGQVLHILKGHTAEVTNGEFSPDNKYVATSSRDDTVRLWDADTGSELVQLLGHTHDVVTVNFSPDGRHVVSASLDGTARIHFVHFEDVLAMGQSLLSAREWTCAEQVKYLREQVVCPTPTIPTTVIPPVTVNSNDVPQAHDTFIENIITATFSGEWEKTLNLLERAEANNLPLDPILDDSGFLNELCWRGSLNGYAAEFLEYCERAVDLVPDDPAIRDSRGLARVLTGDYFGAIEDFQFFVDHYGDETLIEQREQWIVDLKAGKNPITPEVLEELRNQ